MYVCRDDQSIFVACMFLLFRFLKKREIFSLSEFFPHPEQTTSEVQVLHHSCFLVFFFLFYQLLQTSLHVTRDCNECTCTYIVLACVLSLVHVHSAMDHAGIGPTHVNNFLTTLNIPAVDEKVLRRQERRIGATVEQVARESCEQATREEVEQTDESAGGITMSYDCGWQKRGKAMNSITGVGHAIGEKTHKVQ